MSGDAEEVSTPISDRELAELKKKREQRDAPQKQNQKNNRTNESSKQPASQKPSRPSMQQQTPQHQGVYGPQEQPAQQQMIEYYQQQMLQQQMLQQQMLQQQMMQQQMMQQQMPRFTEPQVEAFMLADAITAAMDVVGEGIICDRLIRAREIICRSVGINESAIYGGGIGDYESQQVFEEDEDQGDLEVSGDDGTDLEDGEGPEEPYNPDMPQESIG